MQNEKRPTSVTVIAWIIFVMGVLVLIAMFLGSSAPSASNGLFVVWGTLGGVFCIVTGVAMLKGLNWGRLLYLWVAPISIVLESLVLGFQPADIVRGTLYLVILFFLTRPTALKYFGLSEGE